jgi:hypothetical protein
MFEVDMGDQRGREDDRRNSCTEVDSLFEESQAVEVDSGKRQRKKVASKISSDSLFEDRRVERKEGAKQPSVEICVLSGAFSYNFGHVHIVDESIFFCVYNPGEIFGHP